jgi:metal-responsive CopG/Arc/MetJ family transcriptional regulator
MSKMRITITIEDGLVKRIDSLVAQKRFSSRSRAFQFAVQAQLQRLDQDRLTRECAKLDQRGERLLADEGSSPDLEGWPGY